MISSAHVSRKSEYIHPYVKNNMDGAPGVYP